MRSYKFFEFFIYLILIIIPYFFFYPEKEQKHLHYITNAWYKNTLNLNKASVHSALTNFAPFKRNYYYYKNRFFYYNAGGDITHALALEPHTLNAPSSSHYCLYPKAGEQITLYNKYGYKKWVHNTAAYPYLSFSGNRIVLFTTDNTAYSIYDYNLNKIYENTFFGSLITDFEFCGFNDKFIIGDSRGKVETVNYEGERTIIIPESKSQYKIIKNVKLSQTGRYAAVLHGSIPEYLSLYNEEGSKIWQVKTGRNRRKHISLYVDSINGLVMEPSRNSLIIRNLKNGQHLYELDLSNLDFKRIRYVKYTASKNLIYLALTTDGLNYIIGLRPDGFIISTKAIYADDILYVELFKKKSLMIHTSLNIICYNLHHY